MKIIITIIQAVFCTLMTLSVAFGSEVVTSDFTVSALVVSSATLTVNPATESGLHLNANTSIQPTVTFIQGSATSPSRYEYWF